MDEKADAPKWTFAGKIWLKEHASAREMGHDSAVSLGTGPERLVDDPLRSRELSDAQVGSQAGRKHSKIETGVR